MRGTDWRLRPTTANGQPALAAYVRAPGDDTHRLHTLQVFTADHGAVSHTVAFRLPTVFAAFGLAEVWEGQPRRGWAEAYWGGCGCDCGGTGPGWAAYGLAGPPGAGTGGC